ncbi:MAG: RNA polymerase sigma factor [Frankia sp.]
MIDDPASVSASTATAIRPGPEGLADASGPAGSASEQSRLALVRLVRDEGRRVLATLVRTTGSVPLAEDAVQDAIERALLAWPRDGLPANPRAWLTLTARRRAVDLIRREATRDGKEAQAMVLLEPDDAAPPSVAVARDDLLRLVFTCCHPALSVDAQVALSLRTLCGLSTGEVARALLVREAAMVKRLTRTRQKIAQARIPYRIPSDVDLPDRVAAVAATVYLMFNEGYLPAASDDPLRPDLADEAVRLGRLLRELLPAEPSVLGLLGLMLLQDARRDARFDAEGELVLLPDQDRARWRADLINEGVRLVGEGLRRSPDRPDPYVVQGAIAACHALAPSYSRTDWDAVLSWYDVLLTVHDTAVVRLNRAAALAERDGPAAGLAAVDAITGLGDYPLWYAARGELLARLGRVSAARADLRAALDLPLGGAQRRHLVRRLADLV